MGVFWLPGDAGGCSAAAAAPLAGKIRQHEELQAREDPLPAWKSRRTSRPSQGGGPASEEH